MKLLNDDGSELSTFGHMVANMIIIITMATLLLFMVALVIVLLKSLYGVCAP
jgi:hypothetical protein